ncbi:beta-lactamase family protein, partial [Streptomyces sp. SID7982]|nr:beta-lactamase family protein [Streptomyces sp. SID7982]
MTTTTLQELLDTHIARGSMPGAVALVARGERVEAVSAGTAGLAGSAPMRRDSLFRIASITKPIVAAAAMTLVEDGL